MLMVQIEKIGSNSRMWRLNNEKKFNTSARIVWSYLSYFHVEVDDDVVLLDPLLPQLHAPHLLHQALLRPVHCQVKDILRLNLFSYL